MRLRIWIGYFACLLIAGMLRAQTPNMAEYRIDRDAPFGSRIDLSAFPDGGENAFYLFGEVHGCTSNPIYFYELLLNLHRDRGVRTVVLEFGHAEAWIYNRYLHTGDTLLFNYLEYGLLAEYRELWMRIYHWNARLPEADRIRVEGIDFERAPAVVGALQEMFFERELMPPKAIRPYIAHIDSIDIDSLKMAEPDMRDFGAELRAELEAHESAWREWLGEKDFTDFRLMALNGAYYERFRARDKEMARNFERLQDMGRLKGPLFASFGWSHANMSRRGVMARRLQRSETPYADHMISILMLYPGCRIVYSMREMDAPEPARLYSPRLRKLIQPYYDEAYEDDQLFLPEAAENWKTRKAGFDGLLILFGYPACEYLGPGEVEVVD